VDETGSKALRPIDPGAPTTQIDKFLEGVQSSFQPPPPDYLPPGEDDLAYGFFTSGSTGKPKCCLNKHRGLENRFAYMSERFQLMPGEAVLQNSKHVFDSSLWQGLWPLTVGATVVIPDRRDNVDIDYTLDLIAREKVAMTDFVPSIFGLFVRALRRAPQKGASLKHILIGGESASAATVEEFYALGIPAVITNTYGPTEASIGMAFEQIPRSVPERVPLGTPIANTLAVVVAKDMRPASIEEIGDILIGGVCLGAGYLNDELATKAAFIDNPFPFIPGRRLYRTGDRGHVGSDGKLYFDGRLDDQLKIAGVRIDLGEIVSVMEMVPGVHQAVALPVRWADGTTWLGAVFTGDDSVSQDIVAKHCALHLPQSSRPTRILKIEKLPLGQTGKIDRKRLSVFLDEARSIPADDTIALTNALRDIWRRLLGEHVNERTHFFEAGGNSLMAVSASLLIEEKTGIPVHVSMLYRYPTPRSLARSLIQGGVSSINDPSAMAFAEDVQNVLRRVQRVQKQAESSASQKVLLTGVTGYVGKQLLVSLLQETANQVTCLVRGDPQTWLSTVVNDGLITAAQAKRVTAIQGDIEREKLGLNDVAWRELSSGLAAIYHAAARVNFLEPYITLRGPNVLAIPNILLLSWAAGSAPVHFISSAGVRPVNALGEQKSAYMAELEKASGYLCTKSVAELHLEIERQRGLPVYIYRLGEVMPSGRARLLNDHSLTQLILFSIPRLQMAPRVPFSIDYSQNDVVCSAIVRTPCERSSPITSLFNPVPLTLPVFVEALRRTGCNVANVPYDVYWSELSRVACEMPSLQRLQAVLPAPDSELAGVEWFRARFQPSFTDIPSDECHGSPVKWGDPISDALQSFSNVSL